MKISDGKKSDTMTHFRSSTHINCHGVEMSCSHTPTRNHTDISGIINVSGHRSHKGFPQ